MLILFYSHNQLDAIIGFDFGVYNVLESDGFVTVTVMVIDGVLGRDIVVTLQTSDGTAVCKLDQYLSTVIYGYMAIYG